MVGIVLVIGAEAYRPRYRYAELKIIMRRNAECNDW